MKTLTAVIFAIGILVYTGIELYVFSNAINKVAEIERFAESNNSSASPNTSLTNGSYFEVLGVHPENVEVTIRDYEQHGYIWYENNYEGELVNITFIRK